MLKNFITIPDEARLAYLMSEAADQLAQQKLMVEFRKFYAGEHQTQLSERLQQFLGMYAANVFRFNLCPVVVEALVERLAMTGFEEIAGDGAIEADEGEEPGEEAAGLTAFGAALWEANRLDLGQEEIYRQAGIDGITYLVLDIDPLGQIITPQNDAYTEPSVGGDGEGIKLHFTTAKGRGAPVYASKRWTETTGAGGREVRRLVLYYPDRIERYVMLPGTKGEGGWQRDIAQAGPMAGVWPQPWTDAAGQPLGLPVVEFRNGRASELQEVIPLQRAVNKALIDLVAAGDMSALGVLFAAGWSPTSNGLPIITDERGKVTSGNKPLAMEPGAIFYTTNPEGKLTRVEGDDLTRLISLLDRLTLGVAQVTRTPITNFQLFGQIPSAASQAQLEGGLLAKVQSRQRGYGNAWEDLIYLAWRVAQGAPLFSEGRIVGYGLPAYAKFTQAQPVRVSALWKSAQTRNEKELLETLKIKKDLGVPEHQLYLEMGYDDAQADKFAAEAEARRLAGVAMQLEAQPSQPSPPAPPPLGEGGRPLGPGQALTPSPSSSGRGEQEGGE